VDQSGTGSMFGAHAEGVSAASPPPTQRHGCIVASNP
jgi:hypothetical protein